MAVWAITATHQPQRLQQREEEKGNMTERNKGAPATIGTVTTTTTTTKSNAHNHKPHITTNHHHAQTTVELPPPGPQERSQQSVLQGCKCRPAVVSVKVNHHNCIRALWREGRQCLAHKIATTCNLKDIKFPNQILNWVTGTHTQRSRKTCYK